MILNNSEYTTESVMKGHPDKVCDQISDAILDAYLQIDRNSHTAIECVGCGNRIIVAGEVKSEAEVNVENIVRNIYKQIGYQNEINFSNLISIQSSQLANGVLKGGASDQGVMYGYACDTSTNYLPIGSFYANAIAKEIDEYRLSTNLFLPDGKVQVTVRENKLQKVTVNVQHEGDTDLFMLRNRILNEVIAPMFANDIIPEVEINKDTGFINGGFLNDTGLTGRKIIVDTYGGIAPHGGGAFSGKDPSKVDRSAAYMARFVAKNVVANGYAHECLVSIAYEFGEEKPSMLLVKTDGNVDLTDFVNKIFDFRPRAIIEQLSLKDFKYLPTATYGHFTNNNYPWEKIINI